MQPKFDHKAIYKETCGCLWKICNKYQEKDSKELYIELSLVQFCDSPACHEFSVFVISEKDFDNHFKIRVIKSLKEHKKRD